MPKTRKLLNGWLEITPDEGGDPYYWHKKDNVTTWDKPPKLHHLKPKPPDGGGQEETMPEGLCVQIRMVACFGSNC